MIPQTPSPYPYPPTAVDLFSITASSVDFTLTLIGLLVVYILAVGAAVVSKPRPVDSLTVRGVQHQTGRTLLYGTSLDFYIVAPEDTDVSVGDRIEYKVDANNPSCGWFIRKKK